MLIVVIEAITCCAMKYQHLFFDLDHTLWDFESNSKYTLQQLYIQNNLLEKGVGSFELFFEKYSYHNHRLWDRFSKGFIKQEELRWKRMWLTLLDFKIADETLSRLLAQQFLEQLPLQNNLFPHTLEILNYLLNKNYVLHLITNGFEQVQHHKLRNSGLTPYFQQVVTSEGSNSTKPNVAIFDYALNKAKAQKNHSIMIGDNLEADIQGGINAGLDTVFVNHIGVDPHIHATYTITHLQQLENIF